MELRNLHLIDVTYLGPTNTRGDRVKLHSPHFDQSVIITYEYGITGIYNMARDWLVANGFDVVGMAETKKGFALLSDTFKPLK